MKKESCIKKRQYQRTTITTISGINPMTGNKEQTSFCWKVDYTELENDLYKMHYDLVRDNRRIKNYTSYGLMVSDMLRRLAEACEMGFSINIKVR